MIWDANLPEFVIYAGRLQLHAHTLTSEPWYKLAIQKLKDEGYQTPPVCDPESMLGGVLCGQVKEKRG